MPRGQSHESVTVRVQVRVLPSILPDEWDVRDYEEDLPSTLAAPPYLPDPEGPPHWSPRLQFPAGSLTSRGPGKQAGASGAPQTREDTVVDTRPWWAAVIEARTTQPESPQARAPAAGGHRPRPVGVRAGARAAVASLGLLLTAASWPPHGAMHAVPALGAMAAAMLTTEDAPAPGLLALGAEQTEAKADAAPATVAAPAPAALAARPAKHAVLGHAHRAAPRAPRHASEGLVREAPF